MRLVNAYGQRPAELTYTTDTVLAQVTLKKYAKLSPKTFIGPLGSKRIAVIRASGAITGAEAGGPTSSGINASQVCCLTSLIDVRGCCAKHLLDVACWKVLTGLNLSISRIW